MRALFFHELRKLVARRRSWIGFGAFAVLQLTLLALLQLPKPRAAVDRLLSQNALPFDEFYQGLTLAVVIIAFTFTLLGALFVALVGGDIVAKEVEEGTMRMLLSRPVSRLRLLAVKYAACCGYTFALVLFLGLTALALATAYRGGLGKLFVFIQAEGLFATFDTAEGLWRYVRAVSCLAFATITIASLAFMFSCFAMKPVSATVLTLTLFLGDLVLMNLPYFASLRHWFVSHHVGFWVRTFQDPVPWAEVAVSVAVVVGVSLSAFVIGAGRFCTRDLKG